MLELPRCLWLENEENRRESNSFSILKRQHCFCFKGDSSVLKRGRGLTSRDIRLSQIILEVPNQTVLVYVDVLI